MGRMLAASTSTEILDNLIKHSPMLPHFYRTRAMIHGFREDFVASIKDFKTAIQLVKKNKKSIGDGKSAATVRAILESNNSSGNEAQLFFLRAASYHQYAVSIINKSIRKVNSLENLQIPNKKKRIKGKKKADNEEIDENTMKEIVDKANSNVKFKMLMDSLSQKLGEIKQAAGPEADEQAQLDSFIDLALNDPNVRSLITDPGFKPMEVIEKKNVVENEEAVEDGENSDPSLEKKVSQNSVNGKHESVSPFPEEKIDECYRTGANSI